MFGPILGTPWPRQVDNINHNRSLLLQINGFQIRVNTSENSPFSSSRTCYNSNVVTTMMMQHTGAAPSPVAVVARPCAQCFHTSPRQPHTAARACSASPVAQVGPGGRPQVGRPVQSHTGATQRRLHLHPKDGTVLPGVFRAAGNGGAPASSPPRPCTRSL